MHSRPSTRKRLFESASSTLARTMKVCATRRSQHTNDIDASKMAIAKRRLVRMLPPWRGWVLYDGRLRRSAVGREEMPEHRLREVSAILAPERVPSSLLAELRSKVFADFAVSRWRRGVEHREHDVPGRTHVLVDVSFAVALGTQGCSARRIELKRQVYRRIARLEASATEKPTSPPVTMQNVATRTNPSGRPR